MQLIKVEKKEFCLKNKRNCEDILLHMNKTYNCTDTVIWIGLESFECHIYVLKSYSVYFQESRDNLIFRLPKKEVTIKAFKQIYNWMLNADYRIERENFVEVCNAAFYLKIPLLAQQVTEYVNNYNIFYEDKAFSLYLDAAKFPCDISDLLIEIMLNGIEKCFLQVVASKEFTEMPFNHICILLGSKEIRPRTEIDVFMSALRWLVHDYKNRRQYAGDIMKYVRFSLIPLKLLCHLKHYSECSYTQLIMQNKDVLKLIDRGISHQLVKALSKSSEEYQAHMKGLKFTEPIERRWISDTNWTDNCKSDYDLTLKKFRTFLFFSTCKNFVLKNGNNTQLVNLT